MTRDEEILDKWVCNIVTNSAEQFTATTTKHELLDLIRRVRLDELHRVDSIVREALRGSSPDRVWHCGDHWHIESKGVAVEWYGNIDDAFKEYIRQRKDTP